MDRTNQTQHLDQHLSPKTIPATTTFTSPELTIPSTSTATTTTAKPARTSRTKVKTTDTPSAAENPTNSGAVSTTAGSSRAPRRSARISLSGPSEEASVTASTSGKGKKRAQVDKEGEGNKKSSAQASDPPEPSSTTDRKGKKRAAPIPSSPLSSSSSHRADSPVSKKAKVATSSAPRYSLRSKPEDQPGPSTSSAKGKGKAKAKVPVKGKKTVAKMPKKVTPRLKRPGQTSDKSKKGDSAAKHLIDNDMDEDEGNWVDETGGPSGSRYMGDDHDEDMNGSEDDEDHSDEDDHPFPGASAGGAPPGASGSGAGSGLAGGSGNPFERLNRLVNESGLQLDEATQEALFGGGFRAYGGLMSGLSNRLKRLRTDLRNKSSTVRLNALRELSELLLVSNEDTLGAAFSTTSFATEFIAILNGKPNIDDKSEGTAAPPPDEMDEDAQLAAALAMSTGGMPNMGDEDEMECQLVACRCLAHLLEALPGTGHTLVHLGAVPVLCSKLQEIAYIELAEQTLSTMEKISAEYPSAIVKENGLGALLNYLPFFSTNVQRTAVTAAANCCRNIAGEHYEKIKEVFPILRETLTQGDQRLVEQATLAVVRTIEAYRHNASHLEGLLDVPTVVAVNSLLMPSGGSPLLTPNTYTHLLKSLTTSARGSAKVSIAFLEAGMTNTLYQILTGVLPPSHDEDEQGGSDGGQGLAGGVADMAVLQNLAHRPKDQVEEALALICELLPPTPRDGVFDSKAYTEKSLARIKKGRKSERSERPTRRSSRHEGASNASTGPSTPLAGIAPLPGAGAEASASTSTMTPANMAKEAAAKAKREAEAQLEQRIALFNGQPLLIGKFIRAITPVLVDVYAASVTLRVRTKVLAGLVKAVAFAGQEELRITLQAVPMASFLGSIISSKDNPYFVLSSLQLVELLATKLPEVYQTSFLREGVVFEIESLAKQETTAAKAAAAKEADVVKKEPDTEEIPVAGPSNPPAFTATSTLLEDIKPLIESGAMPSGLTSFLMESVGMAGVGSPSRKPASTIDPNDMNIIRARIMLAKKVFDIGGDHTSAASAVLVELEDLVKQICLPEASDGELRDSLRDIAIRFSSAGQALSSFELLKGGLIDGLLQFVDIEGTITSSDRRAMFFDVFSDTALSSPSPLTMLVKRLHESLGRLETFEVETAFNGMQDSSRSSSGLGRTIRIKLQAEEGQDIPKSVSALSLTIQAIAPMQALHDYLRPRVADGNYMSRAGLDSMFASYAGGGIPVPRGGAGSSASRLLSALAASGAGGFGSGAFGGMPSAPNLASSAPESSARFNPPPPVSAPVPATPAIEDKPQRRRSARLSAQGAGGSATATGSGAAEPSSSSGVQEPPNSAPPLSSSAPEPSILPQMALDMDFDDDDYSEDDYDAEVFEDEMEEELVRPPEKVVNMNLAPDGSRVEAKTPEGTRVATPSQAATATMAGPSGSATPRTGSYAGAVKTAPVDWHLEFNINGKGIDLTDTIYGAVHRNKSPQTSATPGAVASSMGVPPPPIVIKFKKVDGPANTVRVEAPSPEGADSIAPEGLDDAAPTYKILRLLRVVHNLTVEEREIKPRDPSLDENLFVNNKLTAKLTRQLEEIMIIASKCLPDWAVELPKHFSFLFPFETRYSFLQSTSFGSPRLIAKYTANQQSRNGNNSSSRRHDDVGPLGRVSRQKVRISRSQLLESAAKVLELYGHFEGILEIEYFDEIGTGLGPTLEFYSLASKEFARRDLGLWRDEDETKEGKYVYHPKGLFPRPLRGDEADSGVAGSKLSWYKNLGLFVGRALQDSRIIDVNLNKVMLKMVLGQPIKKSIATLKMIDSTLARSLEGLQHYVQAKKEIEALPLPAVTKRNKLASLSINGAKLHDLSLDFTLPGYNIELMSGGALIDVDDSNIEEYLERVLEMTLGKGVEKQIKAFQDGFSVNFSIRDMRIFSFEELGLLFGNADEDWSRETLEHVIKADHGYNLDSRTVQNLIDVMSNYDQTQRRQFLQFITGAPKLPIGGFRGLTPPFTVVRKPHEAPLRADDYLPSVMTCAQYLKLPDYSTKEVLTAQIYRAMMDGGGSFHLS